jgi:MoxR-like ATPase
LEEERPKIICIDELAKMPQTFQNQLLNFMESGRVKVDQQRRQYDFEIKGAKIFGSCNEVNRLSKPLQSRFRKLFLPRYTEEKFLDAATKAKPKTETAPVSKPKRVENNNCKICGKYVDWWQNAVQQDTSLLHEKCYNTMGKRNDS